MMNAFTTGHKLIPGLVLLLFSCLVHGKGTASANYVKPGIDLTSYTQVFLMPLNVSNIEILKPAWEQGDTKRWELQIEDLVAVQELFMNSMQKELESNGGYALVSEPAADVLRIEVEVLSITPYVRPGTSDKRRSYKIETLGSGELVFSAEFRDSTTRELLILVEGDTPIGEEYRELSVENHRKNLAGDQINR
jgi:hypothetical protein